MMSAERNELSVTPASRSTDVEIAWPCLRREPVDDRRCGGGAGQAGGGTGGERTQRQRSAEDDHQHRAERGSGGHAERERRGERVPQHRLKDHAGRGERRADERAREDARKPRDEEDLRVDVAARTGSTDRTHASG